MLNIKSLLISGLVASCSAISPAAIYDGGFSNDTGSRVELRIGNGGAGQSGLIRVLSDAFIRHAVARGAPHFHIEWYISDTTSSIKFLSSGDIDVGITYSPPAEDLAIKEGIAVAPSHYIFRDHFLLAGPKANPARLSPDSDNIGTMLAKISRSAETEQTSPPVRFLSRFDKSATNIKESGLWAAIGQVPWATAYSTWYHQFIAFPIRALTTAILLQEYTITDRGTLLSLSANLRNDVVVYKAGSDDADDPLLNPAHLLVGEKARNMAMALAFAEWATSSEGQDVIKGFEKNGEVLYSGAP
ncbi:hypothetical protein ED733_001135 [Metarhizium rileyi]|uniref:PBP domain-containing protein n=1 Tax=Metarhizium rileyi (strain RCEF 4871) TaxID=1649241 RepID=A0A5C6G395_METRR|nr:hypothetical protein ED733_001135 [Metarhizium rileyi]